MNEGRRRAERNIALPPLFGSLIVCLSPPPVWLWSIDSVDPPSFSLESFIFILFFRWETFATHTKKARSINPGSLWYTGEIVWTVFLHTECLYCYKRLIDWHSQAACDNNMWSAFLPFSRSGSLGAFASFFFLVKFLIIMSVLRKPGMMIRFDVVPRPVWTLILFNSVAHYNHLYFFPRIWFPSFFSLASFSIKCT